MVLLIKLFYINDSVDISGQILLAKDNNGRNEIAIYDCSNNEFTKISSSGLQAVFLGNESVLLHQFDTICEHNLVTDDEKIIYQDEPFDFFAVCSDKALSLSKDNYIFLYSKETREKKVLVSDNGSETHSWSDDGEILYYSDQNERIKAVNVLSGNTKECAAGYDPIVCKDVLAYKNKDKLIVKNLKTKNEYRYDGSAYSYCFSPNSNALIIEDEISFTDAVKNFFDGGVVLGHSLVVWDFENNESSTLMDSCVSVPNMICDWK